ncbi:ATP-binding cassette domain-containing protein [Deinococcus detaillensis]|uniref:ATP-binding cassette domain-containing protein n=1 Tax=Deinococcus detaillensis TaxID=2592048 RepID=A0A553USS3_9DEIO|nr:ATP-binding cassette domain-containing protein [Deinococcus detaillensis]TSA83051.1 ATP-binding cassette domain-containing protein [Deinococcus detaillensis]
MLKIQNLGKAYGDFQALKNITLEAGSGEVFGLLGANGAGKTTLLRTLATLLSPTSGTASVNGYDIVRQAQQVRASIGLVNGGMGLHDRLTGRETLRYFASLYGMTRAATDGRIETLSQQLDLHDLLDIRAGGFSTGMKQKIVVARALIHDPPVLLLDEAASGLDVLARRILLDLVLALKTRERLIVYSTHVMSEVEELCDRVAVIAGGEVLKVGTVPELVADSGESNLERAFFKLLSEQKQNQRGKAVLRG